jgi:hypothetical protein
MILKIYSNQFDQVFFKKEITDKLLDEYNIQPSSDNFTELFETELLNDILEKYNINSSEVYYELK